MHTIIYLLFELLLSFVYMCVCMRERESVKYYIHLLSNEKCFKYINKNLTPSISQFISYPVSKIFKNDNKFVDKNNSRLDNT